MKRGQFTALSELCQKVSLIRSGLVGYQEESNQTTMSVQSRNEVAWLPSSELYYTIEMPSDPLLLRNHLACCQAHVHQIYDTITPPSAEATLVMQSKDIPTSL